MVWLRGTGIVRVRCRDDAVARVPKMEGLALRGGFLLVEQLLACLSDDLLGHARDVADRAAGLASDVKTRAVAIELAFMEQPKRARDDRILAQRGRARIIELSLGVVERLAELVAAGVRRDYLSIGVLALRRGTGQVITEGSECLIRLVVEVARLGHGGHAMLHLLGQDDGGGEPLDFLGLWR